MQESRFPCPHCYSTLRLRDRGFLGQTIDCPDCTKPVFILSDEDGRLFGIEGQEAVGSTSAETGPSVTGALASPGRTASEKATAPRSAQPSPVDARPPDHARPAAAAAPVVPASRPTDSSAKAKSSATPPPRKSSPPVTPQGRNWLPGFLSSPLTLAWLFAIGLTVLVVVAILPDRNRRSVNTAAAMADDEANPATTDDAESPPVREQTEDQVADSLDARMHRLYARMNGYVTDYGTLPGGSWYVDGTPQHERLSWLARLEQQGAGNGLAARPGMAWNHETNEKYVRRSRPELLNPAWPTLVGDQGYPATHFVGVAGIGVDGPSLPASHPRAGVFGLERKTSWNDIADGRSNTMMVAPVTGDLGSWARAGRSTIRPFVTEPYINGPDGFGSGEPNQMPVLMADGSVRTISGDVDPVVFRRMVAMNDGLPLDPTVTGDPVELAMNTQPEKFGGAPTEEDVKPVEQPMAEESPENRQPDEVEKPAPEETDVPEEKPEAGPPAIPIGVAMQQPIQEYELSEAHPLEDVIFELEELLGRPIAFAADVDEKVRQTSVSLSSSETTVGEILEDLAAQAGLEVATGDDGIELRRFD